MLKSICVFIKFILIGAFIISLIKLCSPLPNRTALPTGQISVKDINKEQQLENEFTTKPFTPKKVSVEKKYLIVVNTNGIIYNVKTGDAVGVLITSNPAANDPTIVTIVSELKRENNSKWEPVGFDVNTQLVALSKTEAQRLFSSGDFVFCRNLSSAKGEMINNDAVKLDLFYVGRSPDVCHQ